MFLDRIAALAHVIEHEAGARLPGSRRLAAREKAARDGVTVDAKLLSEARALAGHDELVIPEFAAGKYPWNLRSMRRLGPGSRIRRLARVPG